MKRLGRKNRPFYRICAMDVREPRNGNVIEELGTYDPLVLDVDARCVLNGTRVQYWLGVGALPSDKVGVLIKKYGIGGTHAAAMEAARARLASPRVVPPAPEPVFVFGRKTEAEAPDTAANATEAPAEATAE